MSKPGNQHRVTPQSVLDVVEQFGPIALDPCWNQYSLVNAEFVCDGIESDGLASDWGATVEQSAGGCIWLNYPWSAPMAWFSKAVEESKRSNGKLDILIYGPVYPETEASALLWEHAIRICFLGKRYGHPEPPIDDEGNLLIGHKLGPAGQAKQPTWIAYFGRRSTDFERVFGPHGNIIWGWNTQAESLAKLDDDRYQDVDPMDDVAKWASNG